MTTSSLFIDPQAKPLSTTGLQQAGCYLCFFLTGTVTPTPVYQDGALTIPLSQPAAGTVNPVGGTVADASGRFVPIYINPATTYRVQMYTAAGVKIEDTDPYITGGSPPFTTSTPGSVPASGGGVLNFLRADGTWAAEYLVAVKAANTTRVGTGAATNDPDLAIVVPAAGTYLYELMAFPLQATAPACGAAYGMNFAGTYDNAASLNTWDVFATVGSWVMSNTGLTGNPSITSLASGQFSTVSLDTIRVFGVLVALTAGTLGFSWTQSTTDGVHGTTMGKGSYLKVTRVV